MAHHRGAVFVSLVEIAACASRRPVLPLVRRHAEDAAYLWTQLDAAAAATHLSGLRAAHFASLRFRSASRQLASRQTATLPPSSVTFGGAC